MSQHSKEVAEAAKENPELLGSTNQGSREHQSPATASKVERSMVQAFEKEPANVVGNTSNAKNRAIDEEFVADEDSTKAKIESKNGVVPETPNPENRFAPNNIGLDSRVEGQEVAEEDGKEVNVKSGFRREADDDGTTNNDLGASKTGGSKNPEKNAAKYDRTVDVDGVAVGPTGAKGDEFEDEDTNRAAGLAELKPGGEDDTDEDENASRSFQGNEDGDADPTRKQKETV